MGGVGPSPDLEGGIPTSTLLARLLVEGCWTLSQVEPLVTWQVSGPGILRVAQKDSHDPSVWFPKPPPFGHRSWWNFSEHPVFRDGKHMENGV